jgi:hypothetical protein
LFYNFMKIKTIYLRELILTQYFKMYNHMKLSYLFVFLFLTGFAVNSQMYVSPSTYMYVNDQYVFVTGNVELNAATSNIYLRNQSQLLQGTAVVGGANSGLGALSVYQEGTENNFQYNYWCSPIGGSLAAVGNSSFGITQLGIPTTSTATTAATILPLNNYNGVSGAGTLSIAPYWIWKYTTSTTYAQWSQVASGSTLGAGEGFTMKGTSGSDATVPHTGAGTNNAGSAQRYDFRGKPNDGTIINNVANGAFTLIGNPYPSTIDIHLFLLDAGNAASINGTVYYWDQANVNSHLIAAYQGGYGKYTIGLGYQAADIWSFNADGTYNADTTVNGAVYARRFPPIGQGFMVMGTAGGTTVSMKNTFRNYIKEGAANFSEFAKTSGSVNDSNSVYNPNSEYFPEIPNVAGIDYTQIKKAYAPQLRINARVNDTGIIHTTLGFGDNYTDGFDYSGDARATSDGTPAGFYFILDNQPYEFAMSAAKFDIDKKYPIGLRSTDQSNFKIKVGELLYDFDASQQVYIHDKQTDIYHNIKTGEFDMTLPAGDVRDRFEVTFKEAALNTNDNIASNFDVFQNNGSGILTVKNPKAIDLKSCTLYDVSGKTILSKASLGSNLIYEYSTAGLSEGVYVVKLITGANQEITKKVSVFNKK